jgi:hypothetical protein
MHITRPIARAARLLPALLLAACHAGTEPELGGEYLASLDSPFSVEGAALIELTSADLRSISAPGRVLLVRGVTERTVRVLVMNPPRTFSGGPINLVVRVTDGAMPPVAEVLAVSGANDLPRDFTGGYAVRFTRHEPTGAPPVFTPPPGPGGRVPLVRLVAPFFPGGNPLDPEEQLHVDLYGNSNGAFDFGDLRAYLFYHPGEIPPPLVWSR